jgi:hypothetical protein
MSITDRQRRIIRQALGLNIADESYRNHFVTPADTENGKAWQELVDLGFATGEPHSGMTLFRVTDAGRIAAIPPVGSGVAAP